MEEANRVPTGKERNMKRFLWLAACFALNLAAWASMPSPASAYDCCGMAQINCENRCATLGSSVATFSCVPGYQGSLCTATCRCFPPPP